MSHFNIDTKKKQLLRNFSDKSVITSPIFQAPYFQGVPAGKRRSGYPLQLRLAALSATIPNA